MSLYKAYPGYKDSGVEWLGNIPCDWDCVRLKFASELAGKKVAPRNEERYVGLENVQSNSGKFIATEEVTPEGISNVFSIGDVLFGKLRPYLAKSWLADFSGICSSEFLVMTSRKVDSKFLHYFTLTEEFIKQVDSSTYGSKMPRASWDFIGLLNVPIPSFESEKIAAFLDHETAKIDALIEKQQRLIDLLKEKRQAVISHAVTKGLNPNAPMKDSGVEWLGEVPAHWDVHAIKHIVSTPITDGPHETPEFFDAGIPFVSAEAVSSGQIDFEKIRAHISDADNQRFSKKYSPKKFDIYMVKSGATTGVTAIVETDDVFNIWSPLAAIRCNELNYPYFVLNFMRSRNFSDAIAISWSFGTQQNIGMKVIENLPITRPPLSEAIEIAKYLQEKNAKFDKIILQAQAQIELMQERRTALISAAVTGKIDVRDWQAAA
ncbi:restriction endonuclease subunit S [Limnohabitans sp. DM1]|uniref:restriction endonuclease subunit S n=1 Tax=Limnohabitans sp. DM1 TaxID=1597955 RepID=UPI000AA33923|nr:restriction endonuclease subunit S [Limnohabitans sp. DM1]